MTENGLLELILDRVGRADSAEEIFGADETAEWPVGALKALTKAGLLRPARPAQVIECDGCERYCFKPVHVQPADGGRPARAFISCDEPEDVGRVPVALRRLEQWQATRTTLAGAVTRLLDFTKPPQEGGEGKNWTLGILKGKEHKGLVALSVEDGVSLKMAGHGIPLAEVLTLVSGKLVVDKDELLRLVDKPVVLPGASNYKPSIARRESRKLDTQKLHTDWQKAYRSLKRERRNMSDVWYSQQIAKTDIALGRNTETIRKHMKK
jgi:hypothetical protein